MKFRNNKKDKNIDELPMPIKFDLETLNMICSFVTNTDNQMVTRANLYNTQKLFNRLDKNMYQYDEQLEARFYFVNRALEARLDQNIENKNVIYNYCKVDRFGDIIDNIIHNVETRYTLSYNEVKYVIDMVNTKLSYGFIHTFKNSFTELIEKIELGEFDNEKDVVNDFKLLSSDLLNNIRKTENLDSNAFLDLTEGTFDNVISSIVTKLQRPSNKLLTGVQRLNEIMGGGLERGRLYLFLGLTGGFKSGILLTLAKWIKYYNAPFITKDPEKKPTILFITQENTLEDTVERLFNMTVTSQDIRNFTPDEVVNLLRTKGKFTLTDDNNIDIVFRYYGNEKITTEDLYVMSSELEEEGREIICLIHDYIARFRSRDARVKETREKLGNFANELKNFAIEKDVPVVTASQLNRDASKVIDSAVEGNKEDLGRLLGRSNIAESWSMLQNVDFACIINKEYSNLFKRSFLTFKRIKIRYRAESTLTYFNHPFHDTNEMYLLDDILSESLSKFSLSSDIEDDEFGKKGTKNGMQRKILKQGDTNDASSFNDFETYMKQKYKKNKTV